MDETMCVTCGKPLEFDTACYCCGEPVHLHEPDCGAWILDSWHESAFDDVDGNEFWCRACLTREYGEQGE